MTVGITIKNFVVWKKFLNIVAATLCTMTKKNVTTKNPTATINHLAITHLIIITTHIISIPTMKEIVAADTTEILIVKNW